MRYTIDQIFESLPLRQRINLFLRFCKEYEITGVIGYTPDGLGIAFIDILAESGMEVQMKKRRRIHEPMAQRTRSRRISK